MAGPIGVACFGECMIELNGEAFGTMRQTFGGDSLNTAVYLARCAAGCGLTVSYATAVGDEFLSDGLLARWQAEGIDLGLVRRLPGRMPGLYQISVDPRGERHFSYWRGQSAARDYFEVDETPLERDVQARRLQALYCTGISLAILPPSGRARLLALARRMREQGGSVAFDNNFRPRLWQHPDLAREAHAAMMDCASLLLLTLDDEQALWGETDADRQRARSIGRSGSEIVIKRGALPTVVKTFDGAVIEVPTEHVQQVVDTTAAGDSFAGGYLAARLAGRSPSDAARLGNRLASRVIQHRGALMPVEAMADLRLG